MANLATSSQSAGSKHSAPSAVRNTSTNFGQDSGSWERLDFVEALAGSVIPDAKSAKHGGSKAGFDWPAGRSG
jgi:hypothetical protein